VVGVHGAVAWLEPEQGGTCAHCASSAACGSKGLGTLANRLEARRFPITGHPDLAVGDRVVVGVRGDALVKAALLTYAIPLGLLFVAGGLAQWAAGSDAVTLAASVCGLLLGLGAIKIGAGRLFSRGGSAPAPAAPPGQRPSLPSRIGDRAMQDYVLLMVGAALVNNVILARFLGCARSWA